MKHCFCGCGRRIPRFPRDLRGMNKRGREISERLAWALDLAIAPAPGASAPRIGAVQAGADRAQWAKEGFSHLAELRDAIHGARPSDSVPESPSERWLAEGQYLELIVASKSQLPPITAWLDAHPDAGRELVRRVPPEAPNT